MRSISPLCIVFILFLINYTQAQSFETSIIQGPPGLGAETISIADIDGDGLKDVLVADWLSGSVKWSKYIGDGVFDSPKSIGVGLTHAEFVHTADLDDDGDLDVLSASSFDDKIAWFENDGTGNFGGVFDREIIITTDQTYAGFVWAADIDGDEDLDVISAASSGISGKIYWYENLGDKKFGEQNLIGIASEDVGEVIVYDLNQDGYIDIIYSWSLVEDNTLAWFENDGNGTFKAEQILSGLEYESYYSVFTLDFDKDQDIDIILGDKLFENDGTEKFSHTKTFESHIIHVTDMNADGHLDVFSETSEAIVVHLNNGFNEYEESDTIHYLSRFGQDFIQTSDLENDGDLDILTIDHDSDVFFLENFNSFFNSQKIVIGNIFLNSVFSSDVDLDGYLDVLVASDRKNIPIYYGQNKNTFSTVELINPKVSSKFHQVGEVITCDLQGDEYEEILFSSPQGIYYYTNDAGEFTSYTKLTNNIISSETGALIAFDIDNDNDKDLLSIEFVDWDSPNLLVLRLNNGTGGFNNALTIDEDNRFSVVPADIDSDGKIDILSLKLNSVVAYMNNEMGSFSNENILIEGSFNFIHAADFDSDGNIDIVSASENNEISWHRNNGSGFFDQKKLISSSQDFPKYIEAVDIDGDSDFDVIALSQNDGKISWYENFANGNFRQENIIIQDDASPFNLDKGKRFYVIDIDGDHDVDVLSIFNNRTRLHKNLTKESQIVGFIFHDENANQLFDLNENGIYAASVNIEPMSLSSFNGQNGMFSFFVESGNYNVSAKINQHWEQTTTPEKYDVTISDTSSLDTLLFGFKPKYIFNDLGLFVSSNATTRCGQTIPFSINYVNRGTSILNGNISIVNEHLIDRTENNLSTQPDSIFENSSYWNISNLNPGESGNIRLFYEVASQEFIGDTICLQAKATIPISDNDSGEYPEFGITTTNDRIPICHCTGSTSNPYVVLDVPKSAIDNLGNNDHGFHDCDIIPISDINDDGATDVEDCLLVKQSYESISFNHQFKSVIRCSYDPNDKQADPVGEGDDFLTLLDQNITYTIRFQNTGNDAAYHVQIIDRIDENLDINTFEFISSSHEPIDIKNQIFNQGLSNEYNQITFTFDQIILPDSTTNLAESQGFLSFSISPKKGLTENTIIRNKAFIIFDEFVFFPIVTNEVTHTLVSVLDFPSAIVENDLPVLIESSPNPFRDQLKIATNRNGYIGDLDLSIFSIDGKRIKTLSGILDGETIIETISIHEGVYWLLIEDSKSKNIVGLRKVVKQ